MQSALLGLRILNSEVCAIDRDRGGGFAILHHLDDGGP